MAGWQEIVLIAVCFGLAWWSGRALAPRFFALQRRAAGIWLLVLLVVAVVAANSYWQLLPREVLRLALMFGGLGWTLGFFGFREKAGEGGEE